MFVYCTNVSTCAEYTYLAVWLVGRVFSASLVEGEACLAADLVLYLEHGTSESDVVGQGTHLSMPLPLLLVWN